MLTKGKTKIPRHAGLWSCPRQAFEIGPFALQTLHDAGGQLALERGPAGPGLPVVVLCRGEARGRGAEGEACRPSTSGSQSRRSMSRRRALAQAFGHSAREPQHGAQWVVFLESIGLGWKSCSYTVGMPCRRLSSLCCRSSGLLTRVPRTRTAASQVTTVESKKGWSKLAARWAPLQRPAEVRWAGVSAPETEDGIPDVKHASAENQSPLQPDASARNSPYLCQYENE